MTAADRPEPGTEALVERLVEQAARAAYADRERSLGPAAALMRAWWELPEEGQKSRQGWRDHVRPIVLPIVLALLPIIKAERADAAREGWPGPRKRSACAPPRTSSTASEPT